MALSTSVSRPAVRCARPAPLPRSVSVARRATAARTQRFLVRAEPEKTAVETAIDGAKETCESGSTGECAAAWDEVEELAAAVAHKKAAQEETDPLELYCKDNPETDECRVYED